MQKVALLIISLSLSACSSTNTNIGKGGTDGLFAEANRQTEECKKRFETGQIKTTADRLICTIKAKSVTEKAFTPEVWSLLRSQDYYNLELARKYDRKEISKAQMVRLVEVNNRRTLRQIERIDSATKKRLGQ